MGFMQRNKGVRGVSEFKKILEECKYPYEVLSSGLKCEDLIIDIPGNGRFSCEVKYHEIIKIKAFLQQAREQAKERKLPWMLAMRLPQYDKVWLVLRQGIRPALWQPILCKVIK